MRGRSAPTRAIIAGVCACVGGCARIAGDGATDAINVPIVVGSDTLHANRIRSYLAGAVGFTSIGGRIFCSFEYFGRDDVHAYVDTLCEELLMDGDSLRAGSGSSRPMVLVLHHDPAEGSVTIDNVRLPRDGRDLSGDISAMFPPSVQRRLTGTAGDRERRLAALQAANREAARGLYTTKQEK